MNIIGKINQLLRSSAWVLLFLSGMEAAAEVRPLHTYPETTRLWMGLEEGLIRPSAFEQIRASTSGYMKIHVEHGTVLNKGNHWATVDPELLDLEARSLEMDRVRLDRKLRDTRRTKIEANSRLRLELHEAERSREEFAVASVSPEVPAALRRRAAEAIKEADEKIAELSDLLDPAELEIELQLENDEGELQIERKEKQFRSLKKVSELTTAFAGELRLSESIQKKIQDASDPSQPIWVDGNELIATLVDDTQYEISVTATSPLLAQIPQADILVFFQESRTGKLIEGKYIRTDEVDSGSEIIRNYIFAIQEESLDDARNSVGQRNLIHIYRGFPQKYRLIHKKDIAFSATDILESAGWGGLVQHLWPGSTIVQVGPQTIAVKPSDED